MKKRIGMSLAMALLAWAPLTVAADDAGSVPTFTRDVLPILQQNCQTCHRPNGDNLSGMIAPMSLITYEETRPWAKSIAQQVKAKAMPPWHAAPEHAGVFVNEKTLEPAEVETIIAWAETGARRGNPADAPEPIAWPASEWSIGEPDQIFEMPEPFFVADDVEDSYEYFQMTITEEMLPEPRWLKAVEFKAGSDVVHHIITRPFGGIAPGKEADVFPEGVGRLVEPGTTVTWQMHYHKEPGPGTGVWDQSRVAVKYYENDADVKYPIEVEPLGTSRFEIPAGDPHYQIVRDYTFPEDVRIMRLMPHMHLRGKAALYELTYPDGREEVLLNVPKYDFNWQTAYLFRELKFVPKGTKLKLTTTYDNSAGNPANPDPTRAVRYGEPTTDEMSLGWMYYVKTTPRADSEPAELASAE